MHCCSDGKSIVGRPKLLLNLTSLLHADYSTNKMELWLYLEYNRNTQCDIWNFDLKHFWNTKACRTIINGKKLELRPTQTKETPEKKKVFWTVSDPASPILTGIAPNSSSSSLQNPCTLPSMHTHAPNHVPACQQLAPWQHPAAHQHTSAQQANVAQEHLPIPSS